MECPYLVGAGQADGGGLLSTSAANDVDLGALLVELSTGVAAGGVQGEHLSAEQVLAGLDALGDDDVVAALAVDDLGGSPLAAGVETQLLDLEPAVANTGVGGGVVDLLQVGRDGALVGAVHDVVGGSAGGGQHVAPDGGDGVAGLDVDDERGAGGRVGGAVAGDGVGGHILNGAVVRGDTDTVADTEVLALVLEGGEDGVGADGAGSDERKKDLHGCG